MPVNAIEHVIIPRTENTIKCEVSCSCPHTYANKGIDINSELDELDREEFYRLKKVRSPLLLTDISLNLSVQRCPTRSKGTKLPKTRH